ncbi:MAG TPA: PDDEXK nuclease domain-containing protein [Puia sp.]|nr:PDDEXK nuclease domain-containing protein [Puia sp.]
MNFSELISALSKVNAGLQEQSIRAVNLSLTMRNWFFGFYIVEFEQNGSDRAGYGKVLLATIAGEMSRRAIPNTDERELRRCRQFYIAYPMAGRLFISSIPIQGLAPQGLPINDEVLGIRGTSPELQVADSHYLSLLSNVSYSHLIELIKIENPVKRLFYELECLNGTWSVKELRRQVGSMLYERTGLSKNKKRLLESAGLEQPRNSFPDLIRDPYIFEFVGLKQPEVLPEKELEQALLDHLVQFLLELGRGFCFEARQKRIVIDNEHYFIDLVLYHRLLHCNVLIEMKTERFHHSHAGQLNMYLEYYKKYEIVKGDNPPVGILLCTGKDQEHVEFATAGLDDKVFVSQYLVALPDKGELEEFIRGRVRGDNLW